MLSNNLPNKSDQEFDLNKIAANSDELTVKKTGSTFKINVRQGTSRTTFVAEKSDNMMKQKSIQIQNKPNTEELQKIIKNLKKDGLSQQQIADATGWSQSHISNIWRKTNE